MALTLAEIQAALQQDILDGDTNSLPLLSVPKAASPKQRLFVYQNAYVLRLVGILSEDFDTTWSFLGDQMFYNLARKYIRDCPSNTPNARWFSHRFPEFLAQEDICKQNPVIVEIARMERAIEDAFDAQNAKPISSREFETIAQTGIEQAKLTFHPSVTLLRSETNSCDIFKALREERTPPTPKPEEEPRWFLAWRKELTCRHMELNAEQGVLLDLALQGYNFVQLCEVSATMDNPDTAAVRMAGYLGNWLENELIVQIGSC